MAYYTSLVTGYLTDYIDIKFIEIDTKFSKIRPKITERNPLGRTIKTDCLTYSKLVYYMDKKLIV